MDDRKTTLIDAFESLLKERKVAYAHNLARDHFAVMADDVTWDVWPTTGKWRRRGRGGPAFNGLDSFWRDYGRVVVRTPEAAPTVEGKLAALMDACDVDFRRVHELLDERTAEVQNLVHVQTALNERMNMSDADARRFAKAMRSRLDMIETFLWAEAGYDKNSVVGKDPVAHSETVTPEASAEEGRAGEGDLLSVEDARQLAREAAYYSRHANAYLPRTREAAAMWTPHAWVIRAIRVAYRHGHESGAKTAPAAPAVPANVQAQARGWEAVCDALTAIDLNWVNAGIGNGDGAALAVHAIGQLADFSNKVHAQIAKQHPFWQGTESGEQAAEAIASLQRSALNTLHAQRLGRMPAPSPEGATTAAASTMAQTLAEWCNDNGYEGIGHSIGLLVEELKR